MSQNGPILPFSQLDFDRPVADLEEIRRFNPQRYEMEQVTAILHDDPESGICVGYKDLTRDEMWVRGHMPGLPLMPGVLMCEASAQVCTYHVQRHDMMQCEMIGFGGLDEVRFRDVVLPGDRLVVMAKRLALRPKRLVRCYFQCFVDQQTVCEGIMSGIPIPVELLREHHARRQH